MKKTGMHLVRLMAIAWSFVMGSLALLPASLQAQIVLDNSRIRLGTGFEASVNADGNVEQPFYYNATRQAWRKLTFSAFSLENAVGIGGDKTSEWNANGTIVQRPVLSNQVIDASGFVVTGGGGGTRGYGTIISTGTILVDGKMLEVQNTYVLPQHRAFLKITTSVKNVSSGPVENVRLWIGTRDDWVGTTDVPAKKKGNLLNGKFVPLTAASQQAAALQITSGDEGLLLYTDSPKANTIIQACCNFGNVISQDPQTSPINPTGDASYGFYVRMHDLAVEASDAFTWYYGAGTLDLLPEIIVDVAAANSGMSHIAYNTATFHATVTEPSTGYWMVVPRNTAPPAAAQIKAGAGPVTVAASGAGLMAGHARQSFDIGGLGAGTPYDFYFVAEGADGAFSAVLQVPFATLAYTLPVVSTTAAAAITKAGAVSGGTVAADGGTAITARGVCWSATGMPTLADSKTIDGTGTGTFSSTLTNLAPNTTYFVRSYATNAAGTAYGNLVAVKTSPAAPASLARSADNICAGNPVTLTAIGAVGEVSWYSGDCGGTLAGTGTTITVRPEQTTTYYARNDNGTFSDCAAVTVQVNNAPPTVVGKAVTVALQSDRTASVAAAAFDQGSLDDCGPVSLSLTAGKTAFDCSDVGKSYQLELTATDQQGNTASTTVLVTVADPNGYCNQVPVAVARPLTVSAGASCVALVAAADLDGGSADADGDALAFTISPAGPFKPGATPVTLTVTDPEGASSSTSTTITVVDDIAPVFAAAASIIAGTDAGRCGAVVYYPTPVADDPCGATTVLTSGLASGTFFPVGTTTNTFTATDAAGNVATVSFTVTVTDQEAPVVSTRHLRVQLDAAGQAAITADQVNQGSTDACGIASVTVSPAAFSCADIGLNTVTLTVTDLAGNVATATATVEVIGEVPELSIRVSGNNEALGRAGIALQENTIYLGYGDQQLTLDATGGSGPKGDFTWTGNGVLSSTSMGKVAFAPTKPGVYTFTVTEANPFGCTASSSVTITVVDVRYANEPDLVTLCHDGREAGVPPGVVKAHLDHGDQLGACTSPDNGTGRLCSGPDCAQETGLTVYPNPAPGTTYVEFIMVEAGHFSLDLYDLKGALVKNIAAGPAGKYQFFSYELNGNAFAAGVYLIRLRTDREVSTKRLLIVR